jgi:hypothetical protein
MLDARAGYLRSVTKTRRPSSCPFIRWHGAGVRASVAALRDAGDEKNFEFARTEGAALSTGDAIAYTRRGHGGRKRPGSGPPRQSSTRCDWSAKDSPTTTSPHGFSCYRTVQSHLTHVCTKLGLTSRIQLVHEAARHARVRIFRSVRALGGVTGSAK